MVPYFLLNLGSWRLVLFYFRIMKLKMGRKAIQANLKKYYAFKFASKTYVELAKYV